MLQECGSSTWRIKIGKMKLSSQGLDNLDRHLKLSNWELDNWKWHITVYLLSPAGRTVIYEYGGYNLNEKRYMYEADIYDGT